MKTGCQIFGKVIHSQTGGKYLSNSMSVQQMIPSGQPKKAKRFQKTGLLQTKSKFNISEATI